MQKHYFNRLLIALACLVIMLACNLPEKAPAGVPLENQPLVKQGRSLPQLKPLSTVEEGDEIQQLTRWNRGVAYQMALSQDEKTLLVGASSGFSLIDFADRKEKLYVETGAWAEAMAISADGTRVATNLPDNAVGIFDTASGELLITLKDVASEVLGSTVIGMLFSPDRHWLYTLSIQNGVGRWDLSSGELKSYINHGTAYQMALTDDGSVLAMACGPEIWLWDEGVNQVQRKIGNVPFETHFIAISPDGSRVAASDGTGMIGLYDARSLQEIWHKNTTNSSVIHLRFQADTGQLVVVYDNGAIALVDATSGKIKREFPAQFDWIYNVNTNTAGNTVLYTLPDGDLWMYYFNTMGYVPIILSGFSTALTSVAYSPDGNMLITGAMNGSVVIQDAKTGEMIRMIMVNPPVTATDVAISPDNAVFAAAMGNGDIILHRIEDGREVRRIETRQPGDIRIAFSLDKRLLAGMLPDNTIHIWNLADGRELHTFKGHSMSFTPDSTGMLVGTTHGSVEYWTIEDEQKVGIADEGGEGETHVVIAPNGQTFAAYSVNTRNAGDVRLIQVKDLRFITALWNTSTTNGVVYSSDSSMVATFSSEDMALTLYCVEDGYHLERLTNGHTWSVTDAAFSPDGTTIASVSYDGTLRLWGIPAD